MEDVTLSQHKNEQIVWKVKAILQRSQQISTPHALSCLPFDQAIRAFSHRYFTPTYNAKMSQQRTFTENSLIVAIVDPKPGKGQGVSTPSSSFPAFPVTNFFEFRISPSSSSVQLKKKVNKNDTQLNSLYAYY
jgi:hypothetical protein